MQAEEEDGGLSSLLFSDVLNTMIRFDYVGKNGCCLDVPLISNRYGQTATVGEYFLELIDMDIQDSENKEAFMAMFTELKVHYEKQKIKKILNDNSEQSVKVKRL